MKTLKKLMLSRNMNHRLTNNENKISPIYIQPYWYYSSALGMKSVNNIIDIITFIIIISLKVSILLSQWDF